MAQYAVIVPDSRWHNGRLESSERYSDQQGRHSSKDEAVTTHSVCCTVSYASRDFCYEFNAIFHVHVNQMHHGQ